jgi:hypothetical protein
MAKCSENSCSECPAVDVCCSEDDWEYTIQTLATALLAEKAKSKVWDGAPEDATVAVVVFKRDCGEHLEYLSYETYNRELPKTRTRIIAENIVHGINGKTHGETKDIEYVEGVLKRYAEELKGEA